MAERKWSATLSKTRFNDIHIILTQHVDDDQVVSAILHGICQVMHFDPEQQQYTPELGKRQYQSRKKKALDLGFASHKQYLKAKAQASQAAQCVPGKPGHCVTALDAHNAEDGQCV